jgi:hypothetical protein
VSRKRPGRQTGVVSEKKLTKFLLQLGVKHGQSEILDHVHKIDALVHSVPPLTGFHEPIALQITQKRDEAEKIATFFEKAQGGTKGPMLYAEIEGRVTPSMAVGVRNALVALWLEVPRREEREHRIHVRSNGQYDWLPARAKSKTPSR